MFVGHERKMFAPDAVMLNSGVTTIGTEMETETGAKARFAPALSAAMAVQRVRTGYENCSTSRSRAAGAFADFVCARVKLDVGHAPVQIRRIGADSESAALVIEKKNAELLAGLVIVTSGRRVAVELLDCGADKVGGLGDGYVIPLCRDGKIARRGVPVPVRPS